MSFDINDLDTEDQGIYHALIDRLGTEAKTEIDILCEAIWLNGWDNASEYYRRGGSFK